MITEPDALTAYAPTRKIENRGDTLNEPLLTVRCTSPAPDVLAISIGHFLGGRARSPQFSLAADPATSVTVAVDDHEASITSGALTARLRRGKPWNLEFLADGRVLTASGSKAMALLSTASGESYLREQLSLGVGELVYGLGERFGALVKNGQAVDIWNADGGTSSEQAYKNVPFYLTNAGYGVFVNHPGRSRSRSPPRRCPGSSSAWPASHWSTWSSTARPRRRSCSKYTGLTGRPALPPLMVVRAVAEHLVHHLLRRDDRHRLRRRHGRARPAVVGVPFRLLLDARVPLVRLHLGRPDLPRPSRHARPAQGQGAADLRLDQPLHRPALAVVRRRGGQRLPAAQTRW